MNLDKVSKKLMYPPGAGGSWLMNTLAHLRDNKVNNPNLTGHYHNTPFYPIAFVDHWIIRSLNRQHYVYFTDTCIFNFYLNYNIKLCVEHEVKKKKESLPIAIKNTTDILFNWYNQHRKIVRHPGYINYTNLWHDPDRFEKQFSKLWDNTFDDTHYDKQKLFKTMEKFKSTTINPMKYFGNIKKPLWRAWCWTLIKKYDLTGNSTNMVIKPQVTDVGPELLLELVTEYNDRCMDITRNMTYFYPES